MTTAGDVPGDPGRRRNDGGDRSGAARRLDRADLLPVLHELARRYGDGAAPTTLTVRDLSMTERRAIADLLGIDRLPPPTTRLAISRLTTALGLDRPQELRTAVEELVGPVEDRRATRTARQRARGDLWAWLADELARLPFSRGDGGGAASVAWVDRVRRAGVPGGDVEAHRRFLTAVLGTLGRLPADGIALASLAADGYGGDADALDRGRGAAALVLDAVARLLGQDRPTDAETTRLLWERVGVVPDPLSSTVLTLGLRPRGDDPLAVHLHSMADAGEPTTLTLSQLRRWPVAPLGRGDVAFVVENPTLVVEAADRRWPGAPLICTSGRPTHAVVTLLRQLGQDGAVLAQHADFDVAGLGISTWLADRTGTTPWQMTGDDYLRALGTTGTTVRLRGTVPPTPWDPALQAAMAQHGLAVHEEAVRADLLRQMAQAAVVST